MSGEPLLALTGSLLATAWAALLALADGALAAEPKLAETSLTGALAEKPERFRRALALGRIAFLALAAVALSGSLGWWHAGLRAPVLFVAAVAFVALLGDLAPRALGLWRAARIGGAAVKAAAASLTLLVPVIVTAGVVDRALARLFGVSESRAPAPDLAQRDMLLGVFALADTMVTEVMTPRVDVIGVECAGSFEETVRGVAAAEHARLPAYDGDLDHIVGVLYAKDLLPALFGTPPAGAADWKRLVRPVDIIPETKTLDAQLRDFQRGPGHLAVVVDEFGGTAGIVTLEDVLEEIVGEIRDEYDDGEEAPVVATGPATFAVTGRAPVDALAEALGVPLAHEEVSTAGGLVYSALGHVPVAGETLELAGYRVTVEQVVRRRIRRLRFERSSRAREPERP